MNSIDRSQQSIDPVLARRRIYTLLIAISVGLILGHILAVDRVDARLLQTTRLAQVNSRLADKEQQLRQKTSNEKAIQAELTRTREKLILDAKLESPMLSGNDRSRWCTIRALVEPGMRVYRTVQDKDGTERQECVWYAIDKVQTLKGWDTIDMVKHGFPDRPDDEYLFSSKPPLQPTLMAIPYALIHWGSGGRITLGNDPYLIVRTTLVLLNLIPLAFCWFLLAKMIERFGVTDWGRIYTVAFLCFGTFLSTFSNTLNNHLPAVFCITIASYCAVRIFFDSRTGLWYYFAAGFFSAFAVVFELPSLSFCAFLGLLLLWRFPKQTLLAGVPAALLVAAAFFVTNYLAHKTPFPPYSQRSWYMYEYERGGVIRDSYWKNPVGVDRGEPSRAQYVFHSTLGHHGLFSLTPVWVLSFLGLGFWLCRTRDPRLRVASLLILALSLIVFSFYMGMHQGNRNYGGMTSALRWMFWFVPLWVVPLVSAADVLARSAWGRGFGLLLLLLSAMSASYPLWNPWTQPWPYYLMVYLGLPVI